MILVNEPAFRGNEKKYLNECIDTGWISSEGPFIKRFEQEFSHYVDRQYGVAVSNGTAALEVALYAIDIRPGDEVIIPTFTIISCVLAILRLGATPVLVDIDPETWCMDVSQVEAKITAKTKAIMPVHIYGHPVDMDPLMQLAKQHQLKIVEDAAEVHGAEYKGQKCGSFGAISSFSFYANKLVTTGEGGMVVTDDPVIAERAQSYRNLCFIPQERFLHEELGYNFRMTNLQAAVGVAQLEYIEQIVNFKREMGEYYRQKLSLIEGLQLQIERPWAKNVYWMYAVQMPESWGLSASVVMKALQQKGIGTRPFFRGMHQQPALLSRGFFQNESYPHAERAYQYGFYLPSGMTLTYEQIDQVTDALTTVLAR